MFVDMAMKQNTHAVLIRMPLSGWHLKRVFICLWTNSTRHYLKPSSQENNITRGSGRWMKESYFIAQKNAPSGKASLSLLFLLGAQEVLSIFNSRQGTPGFSLRNPFILACFLSTNCPEPGREKAERYHHGQETWGSRLVSLPLPQGSRNSNSGIVSLTVTPTCFHNWKQCICTVPGPLEAHTYKRGFPTIRLLRYDFGTNWRAIIKTGRAR